jgi:hypothetical protein
MLVVFEPGQGQFAGDDAPAEPGISFQHRNIFAGSRQVGGGDQTVVARADGDDVKALANVASPLWRKRALSRKPSRCSARGILFCATIGVTP